MKEATSDDFVPKISYHVYRICSPDWQLRPHLVDNNDLTYIIGGKARYTINRKVYELGTGDVLFLSEGAEKEAITFPQDLMHCFSVNFSSLHPSSKSKPPALPMVSAIGLRQDIIDMFKELTINWSNQQSGYIMKTRALLMMILHRLSEIIIFDIDSEAGDFRVNKVARTIAMHYSDKLTVKELAEQVQLDEAYFGHLFKQKMGMTVHQYIMQIRVRNAENMMQTGTYKVHEISEHCGFSDVVHFYKTFKALRGFPPSRCKPKRVKCAPP